MRYRNNGQIEEELQIRFTGYLIQAVKRTRRDYLNMLNQYSNSEILTDTTYTTGQTLEQEVTEHLPALFGGQGGNITRQATSLLLRASEVVTDFFMCITQPIAHLCGAWPAVLFYIEHKDAH